jgi:hypothetical protein
MTTKMPNLDAINITTAPLSTVNALSWPADAGDASATAVVSRVDARITAFSVSATTSSACGGRNPLARHALIHLLTFSSPRGFTPFARTLDTRTARAVSNRATLRGSHSGPVRADWKKLNKRNAGLAACALSSSVAEKDRDWCASESLESHSG